MANGSRSSPTNCSRPFGGRLHRPGRAKSWEIVGNADERAASLCFGQAKTVLFSKAHSIRALICGNKERARSVSAYSTLGGTSGHAVRVTYPSSSNVCRDTVSFFCHMPGIPHCTFLKHTVSLSALFSIYMAPNAHLTQSLAKIFRIGQSGNTAFSIIALSIKPCSSNHHIKAIKFPSGCKKPFSKYFCL